MTYHAKPYIMGTLLKDFVFADGVLRKGTVLDVAEFHQDTLIRPVYAGGIVTYIHGPTTGHAVCLLPGRSAGDWGPSSRYIPLQYLRLDGGVQQLEFDLDERGSLRSRVTWDSRGKP